MSEIFVRNFSEMPEIKSVQIFASSLYERGGIPIVSVNSRFRYHVGLSGRKVNLFVSFNVGHEEVKIVSTMLVI